MRDRLKAELVLEALEMAIRERHPRKVVHHSDHGSQYTSITFGEKCREAGVELSMGTVGDCYDNALCESFFATLECELLERRRFTDRTEARREVFWFIEGWYNRRRRHSGLGYMSPVEFEEDYQGVEQGKPTYAGAEGVLVSQGVGGFRCLNGGLVLIPPTKQQTVHQSGATPLHLPEGEGCPQPTSIGDHFLGPFRIRVVDP